MAIILNDAGADLFFLWEENKWTHFTDSEWEWLKNNIWIGGLYNYY